MVGFDEDESSQVVLGPYYDPRVTGEPDNGQAATFCFCGRTEEARRLKRLLWRVGVLAFGAEERQSFAERILKGVQGQLNGELLASKEEMRNVGLHLEAWDAVGGGSFKLKACQPEGTFCEL